MTSRVWRLRADRSALYSRGETDRKYPTPPVDPSKGRITRVRARAVTPAATGYVNPLLLPDSTWAALPDQPTVNYVDFYQQGDVLRTTLGRIQSYLEGRGTGVDGYAAVRFPSGFDGEFADFPMAGTNKFGLFFSRVSGFLGPSAAEVRIRLARGSSTVGTLGTMLRLADGRTLQALGLKNIHYGYTLQGTVQPSQTYPQGGATGPQLYSGVVYYYGRGAITQKVKYEGPSCGNWNSPPGETFSINDYKGIGCIWRGVEVTGYDADGNRWGGSPFGGNNSDQSLLEDCYFHDAKVSSATWSFAGSVSSPSTRPTTRRLKVERNGNTVQSSGQRFPGFNHENVGTSVRHYHPDISVDLGNLWDANHMTFDSHPDGAGNNDDIRVYLKDTASWNTLHPRYMGCFVVKIAKTYAGRPNAQTSAPRVFLGSDAAGNGGVELTPYWHTTGAAPTANLPVSPTTHYVIVNQ